MKDEEIEIPKEIGNYTLKETIKGGSFSRVGVYAHKSLGTEKVFKFSKDPDDDRFFADEVEILSGLDHPNILKPEDFIEEERVYLIMQYIKHSKGIHNVSDYVKEYGPLDTSLAVDTTKQVLEALIYAHEHDVIHRDIKPNNILIDADFHAYLTDFNLAKETSGEDSFQASKRSTGGGSSDYQSPEQMNKEHDKIDERTDVYSLGLTLSFMLLGKVIPGANPTEDRKDVPKELGDLVAYTIEGLYDKRCPSAKEFLERLSAIKAFHQYSAEAMKYIEKYGGKIDKILAKSPDDILLQKEIAQIGNNRQTLYSKISKLGEETPVPEIDRSIISRREKDKKTIQPYLDKMDIPKGDIVEKLGSELESVTKRISDIDDAFKEWNKTI